MQSSENMMVCKRKTSQISVLLKLQLCFLHIEYAVGPQGSASRILACPMWVSVWTLSLKGKVSRGRTSRIS